MSFQKIIWKLIIFLKSDEEKRTRILLVRMTIVPHFRRAAENVVNLIILFK